MKNIVLLLILLLAVFLRFYSIDRVPPALFGDEVDVGYQAYSLLKTGKDLQGNFLPLYIQSLAEYRTPLYIYSAIPFIGIFGLNEWGVRAPAFFWGIASTIGLYLLTKEMFNRRIALAAAFSLTISPWHLQYSRASFEATMLLFFVLIGTYLFLVGLRRRIFLLPAAVFLGLTPYIYSTAVVFYPLFVASLMVIFRKQLFKVEGWSKSNLMTVGALLILLLTALPMVRSTISGEASGRFSVISIFQDSVLVDKINIARKSDQFYSPDGFTSQIDSSIEPLFHNKPTVYAQVFALNYLRAFSLDFLFAQGDPNFRQSIFEMGQLYYFELVTIVLGLGLVLTKVEKKVKWLTLGWLVLAPLPAALTADGGHHATRLFLMLPPLMVLSSVGILFILSQKNVFTYKVLGGVLLFLVVANIVFYFHRYYIHYPVESWRWWHTGFKEAMIYVKENQDDYHQLVINNSFEPSLIRYLFYSRYDPASFHRQFKGDQTKENIIPGVDGFIFGERLIFGYLNKEAKESGGLPSIVKPGMLYLASARDEVPGGLNGLEQSNLKLLKTIVNPKNEPIFYLITGK